MKESTPKTVTISRFDLNLTLGWLETRDSYEDIYFDCETGSAYPEFMLEEVYGSEVDVTDDRFLLIEPLDSSLAFRFMEDYARSAELSDRFRSKLFDALNRPKPFRRFRDVLTTDTAQLDAFDAFKTERLTEEFRDWLKVHGYDLVITENKPS